MPVGMKVSSEIFQKPIQQALEGLNSVHRVGYDVIVHGVDDDQLGVNVEKLLQRYQEHSIKLNRETCQYNIQEIQFLGRIITSHGLKTNPAKIQAVLPMNTPQHMKLLRD